MYQDNVLSNLAITAGAGRLKSMQKVNLATTAGAFDVVSFDIPDWANAFRIHASTAVRYAVSEAPVAISTASFVVGGVLDAGTWVTKSIGPGSSRTVQCLAGATGVAVTMEVF